MPSAFQDDSIATWLEYTKRGGAKKQKKLFFRKWWPKVHFFNSLGLRFVTLCILKTRIRTALPAFFIFS